jgi:hypothetical protein
MSNDFNYSVGLHTVEPFDHNNMLKDRYSTDSVFEYAQYNPLPRHKHQTRWHHEVDILPIWVRSGTDPQLTIMYYSQVMPLSPSERTKKHIQRALTALSNPNKVE